MNNKKILRNFSYSISSNLIKMIGSTITVLLVPKFIGITEYGYWQYYIFISSYVTLFTLGWTDGICLRYTGKQLVEIGIGNLQIQFKLFSVLQIMLSTGVFFAACLVTDLEKRFVIQAIAFFIVFVNIRYFFIHLSQAISNFKLYSEIIVIERVLSVALIVVVLLLQIKDYRYLVVADILGKVFSLLYAMYTYRELFSASAVQTLTLKSVQKDVGRNIKSGSMILLASTMSMLIIGTVRMAIERKWSIETFGRVSLTLSLCNFLLIFISALGLVLFPVFKQLGKSKLKEIYPSLSNCITLVLSALLIMYYPLAFVLTRWLPDYQSSIVYMGIVFPICLFESKVSLLINPGLKAFRMENTLFLMNMLSFFVSLGCSIFFVFVAPNLLLAVCCIPLVLGIRCLLGELFLLKFFEKTDVKMLALQIFLPLVFILCNQFLPLALAGTVYTVVLISVLLVKWKTVTQDVTLLSKFI